MPNVTRQPRPKLIWLKPAVWLGGMLPVAIMLLDAWSGGLGANPLERLLLQAGLLALLTLTLSLLCTPLRIWTGWKWPARIRRELGLLAFFYAALHLLLYILDQGGVAGLPADVLERPFIAVGMAALLLLVPLALTSGKDSVRRLGFQRWTRLHYLVYPSVALGVLHFYWGVKGDKTEPLFYAAVIAGLLIWRFMRATSTEATKARIKQAKR